MEGIGDDNRKENPTFLTIDAKKYELITYHYFIGKFDNRELEFKISASESFGKYGFTEAVKLALHKKLEGLKTPKLSSCVEDSAKDLVIHNLDEMPEDPEESQVKEQKKMPRQESQVADRENNRQISHPTIQPPQLIDVDEDSSFKEEFEKFLATFDLKDAEISGDMFTSHTPPVDFYSSKLEFSIQYGGQNFCKEVEVQVKNDQMGVALFNADPQKFSTIGQGEHKRITYDYSIAEEFNDHELKFEILITYQYEGFVIDNIPNQDFDINNPLIPKLKWKTKNQKWEIKRQVAPYSEVEVTELH